MFVLLVAGLSKAEAFNRNVNLLPDSQQLPAQITDVVYDSESHILKLLGHVNSNCVENVKPHIQFNSSSTVGVLTAIYEPHQFCINSQESKNFEMSVDASTLLPFEPNTESHEFLLKITNFRDQPIQINIFKFRILKINASYLGVVHFDKSSGKYFLNTKQGLFQLFSNMKLKQYVGRFISVQGFMNQISTMPVFGDQDGQIFLKTLTAL